MHKSETPQLKSAGVKDPVYWVFKSQKPEKLAKSQVKYERFCIGVFLALITYLLAQAFQWTVVQILIPSKSLVEKTQNPNPYNYSFQTFSRKNLINSKPWTRDGQWQNLWEYFHQKHPKNFNNQSVLIRCLYSCVWKYVSLKDYSSKRVCTSS